ncbi:MAG: prolyl oligopeptidase family serine peptidase [Oscillospiraceae bacterium]|jgi:predicted esterase|nr:prolyl oligopeptidase family serine peptidase [Oscillospiraceae bacterium]
MLICFSGIEAADGVERREGYNIYHAIINGELRTVKVYPERDLRGKPGYAAWSGVYEADFDSEGAVTKYRAAKDVLTGYSIGAVSDGYIKLGVDERPYRFVPNAPVYSVENISVIQDYKSAIEDLKPDWNDNWFIKLNTDKAIETMWIFKQAGDDADPLLDDIRRFKENNGATEGRGGLDYTYFEPETPGKHPVFVWFHGLHGATSLWTSHFEFNPIARFANPAFQSRFTSGGCFVIVPAAQETLNEKLPLWGNSWNPEHVPLFMDTLKEFLKNHPNADPTRLFIGGYSMGGYMTWQTLKMCAGGTFAGAVPCCSDAQKVNTDTPVWHIHSDGDFFPTEQVRELVNAHIEKSPLSRLLVLPKAYKFPDGSQAIHDHLVWIPTLNDLKYNDGTLYSDIDGVQVQSTLIDWLNSLPSTTAL